MLDARCWMRFLTTAGCHVDIVSTVISNRIAQRRKVVESNNDPRTGCGYSALDVSSAVDSLHSSCAGHLQRYSSTTRNHSAQRRAHPAESITMEKSPPSSAGDRLSAGFIHSVRPDPNGPGRLHHYRLRLDRLQDLGLGTSLHPVSTWRGAQPAQPPIGAAGRRPCADRLHASGFVLVARRGHEGKFESDQQCVDCDLAALRIVNVGAIFFKACMRFA